MRSLALALCSFLWSSSLAIAGADAPPEPPSTSVIAGPFPTIDDYCAFRNRDNPRDALSMPPCDLSDNIADPDSEPRPAPIQGQGIRDYKFVRTTFELHALVQTKRGWYGRSVGEQQNGDGVSIDGVVLRDVVRDRDAELMFEITNDHAPCGCDDLYSRTTETFACTVTNGELTCTDGVTTAIDMHLADIWSWRSTLIIQRNGIATRTFTLTDGISRAKKRALLKPVKLRFHR